jgi:hypothetical protein
MTEANSADELAPCPKCGKRVKVIASHCTACGHAFESGRWSTWAIIGLIVGIPVLLAVSGVLLLVAVCTMG